MRKPLYALLAITLAAAVATPDTAHARKENSRKSTKAASTMKKEQQRKRRTETAVQKPSQASAKNSAKDDAPYAETRHSGSDPALGNLNEKLPTPKGVVTKPVAAGATATTVAGKTSEPARAETSSGIITDRQKMIEELASMNDAQLDRARSRAIKRALAGTPGLTGEQKAKLERDYATFYDTLKVLSPQQRREYIRAFQ